MWTEAADAMFIVLKSVLSIAPILHLPHLDCEFVLDYDASSSRFWAILHQGAGPIAFFSLLFVARHLKEAVYEWELIGLAQAVCH